MPAKTGLPRLSNTALRNNYDLFKLSNHLSGKWRWPLWYRPHQATRDDLSMQYNCGACNIYRSIHTAWYFIIRPMYIGQQHIKAVVMSAFLAIAFFPMRDNLELAYWMLLKMCTRYNVKRYKRLCKLAYDSHVQRLSIIYILWRNYFRENLAKNRHMVVTSEAATKRYTIST